MGLAAPSFLLIFPSLSFLPTQRTILKLLLLSRIPGNQMHLEHSAKRAATGFLLIMKEQPEKRIKDHVSKFKCQMVLRKRFRHWTAFKFSRFRVAVRVCTRRGLQKTYSTDGGLVLKSQSETANLPRFILARITTRRRLDFCSAELPFTFC